MRRQPLNVCGTTNINKMDVTSSVESLSHKTIKQKFMRWASKWYYADIVDENPDKPDATLLICLLQSIGFQLRQFEKSNDAINMKSSDNNTVKVTIECGVSKMKAILELDNVKCQCPNSQDASYASFWSVSGTAPTGSMDCINKFEETGSNLLPRLSKDTHRVIHDIVHSLLNIIKNKMNVNKNMDDNTSVTTFDKITKDYYDTYKTFETPEAFARCYTQPEIPSYIQRHIQNNNNFGGTETLNRHLSNIDIRSALSCKNIPSIITTQAPSPIQNPTSLLIRQKTWDMETKSVDNEPRSSPPKITNSPVITTELCTSLGRVSLQSDDGTLTLMECLKRARIYIEKAQNLQACKQSPSTPASLSRNTYKESDSISKSTTRSKTSSSRNNLQMRSTLSSAAKKKSPSGGDNLQIAGQKIIARRSVSGIGGRMSINSPKTLTAARATTAPTALSTNLPVRRQTVGVASQSLKLAVAGAKRKVDAAKIRSVTPISSGSTTSNSSMLSTASNSRVIVSARRRVSPDINSSPANTISSDDFSQIKLSGTTQTPNNGRSSNIDMITPKSTGISRIKSSGINSGLKKPLSNLPKYGMSKK